MAALSVGTMKGSWRLCVIKEGNYQSIDSGFQKS